MEDALAQLSRRLLRNYQIDTRLLLHRLKRCRHPPVLSGTCGHGRTCDTSSVGHGKALLVSTRGGLPIAVTPGTGADGSSARIRSYMHEVQLGENGGDVHVPFIVKEVA
jgi:hypothetical protein